MGLENTYVIGMDMGTTNIKAVALGNDGRVVADASLPNKFYNPGLNMHEQDANEWWQNVQYIFNTITERIGIEAVKKIRGICISSHTVSLLPVAENGMPLYRALTYQDSRSVGGLREIIEKIGYKQFVRIVGGQPSVAFLPNKILWFKHHEPELFQRTKHFMQASSYINYKLTGVITSDIDQGLRTQCMDIGTLEWSEVIGDAIGVNLKELLPPIKLIDEVIGYVTPGLCLRTPPLFPPPGRWRASPLPRILPWGRAMLVRPRQSTPTPRQRQEQQRPITLILPPK